MTVSATTCRGPLSALRFLLRSLAWPAAGRCAGAGDGPRPPETKRASCPIHADRGSTAGAGKRAPPACRLLTALFPLLIGSDKAHIGMRRCFARRYTSWSSPGGHHYEKWFPPAGPPPPPTPRPPPPHPPAPP